MDKNFIIKPELEIGRGFFYINHNCIQRGFVSDYEVLVTSYIDVRMSWCAQLLNRAILGLGGQYVTTFKYGVKFENTFYRKELIKKGKNWYIGVEGLTNHVQIFFKKQYLLNSLK